MLEITANKNESYIKARGKVREIECELVKTTAHVLKSLTSGESKLLKNDFYEDFISSLLLELWIDD